MGTGLWASAPCVVVKRLQPARQSTADKINRMLVNLIQNSHAKAQRRKEKTQALLCVFAPLREKNAPFKNSLSSQTETDADRKPVSVVQTTAKDSRRNRRCCSALRSSHGSEC